MEQKKKKTPKRPCSAQSIVNNFNSITNQNFHADKAKFYLTKLKEKSGVNEQKLITELILSGFEVSPIAQEHCESIRAEWNIAHPDVVKGLL